mmetsp:Transcript_72942/g.147655  ORF Transcript_72942/g.147655 Transcript_72942/m.147655 type:complete len:105 (-) Transcript_72942:886-1200(-)
MLKTCLLCFTNTGSTDSSIHSSVCSLLLVKSCNHLVFAGLPCMGDNSYLVWNELFATKLSENLQLNATTLQKLAKVSFKCERAICPSNPVRVSTVFSSDCNYIA